MANHTFYNYVAGSTSELNKPNTYFGLYGECTYDQNIAGNYTNVTVDVYIRAYTIDVYERIGFININGTQVDFTSDTIYDKTGNGVLYKIASSTVKIPHNNNGTKTGVNISVSWNIRITYGTTWYETLTASTTVDLPTIPRISTFELDKSSVNVGDKITATITKADSSFYHIARFYINDAYTSDRIKLGENTSYQYTIPSSWSEYITSSSGCKAYCNVATYTGSSYNDTTELVGYERKEFTVVVPSSSGGSTSTSYNPRIKSLSATIEEITTSDNGSQSILVQGKNTVTITANCEASTGSSIKSYAFTCTSGGKVIAAQTVATNSVMFGPFTQTGDLVFSVTVTDSRSNSTTSTTDQNKTVTCYAYTPPSFKSFTAYRSDSSGTQNDSGEYANCEYNISYASVNNTNNLTLKITYKDGSNSYQTLDVISNTTTSSSNYILSNVSTNSAYTIYMTVTDNYGGKASSDSITVFGSMRVFNITSDGTGIALGKLAGSTELFDSRWPISSDDPANTMYNLTNKSYSDVKSGVDTASTWTSAGNLATVFIGSNVKPDSFPSNVSSALLINFTNNDISSTNHAVSQLLSTYGQTGVLYHRSGYNESSMGSWHKILIDSDIPNYQNLSPDVLYEYNGKESDRRGNTSITLNYSSTNYKYLEIFYVDDSGNGNGFTKVYSPYDKFIDLSLVLQPSSVGVTYIKRTRYQILETSITPITDNMGLVQINGSTTPDNYVDALSVKTFLDTDFSYIRITRVLGWNHD